MERVIRQINEMQKDGVVLSYAIGGAVAATFYMEPVETADLDIFVALPVTDSPIITLTSIYEYLSARGHRAQGEHVIVYGIPVQFLATDLLTQEALDQAVQRTVGTESTRVMRAEHLAAIMLRLGRPKDRVRLEMLLREAKLDMPFLEELIHRHGLAQRWIEFKRLLHG